MMHHFWHAPLLFIDNILVVARIGTNKLVQNSRFGRQTEICINLDPMVQTRSTAREAIAKAKMIDAPRKHTPYHKENAPPSNSNASQKRPTMSQRQIKPFILIKAKKKKHSINPPREKRHSS